MKRVLLFITFSLMTLLIAVPFASGQEENVEKEVKKRIKIVTVDKDGKKVELDTTLTDGTGLSEIYPELFEKNNIKIISKDNIKEWKSEDGNAFIMKSGEGGNFSIYTDKEGNISKGENVHIFKKGDGKTYSVVKVSEGGDENLSEIFISVDEAGGKSKVWVSDDEELEDGKYHITIRSKGEIEEMVIEGDAVITIKDGKVTMEGDNAKLHTKVKKDKEKVLKEVEEKKVIKKKKEK